MIMASEESLGAWKDVPNDNCWSQRIDYMLVIRVQKQAVVDVT